MEWKRSQATRPMDDYNAAKVALADAEDELEAVRNQVQQASVENTDHDAMKFGAQAIGIMEKLRAMWVECGGANVSVHLL